VSGPGLARVTHCLGADEALGGELARVLTDRSDVLLVAPGGEPDAHPDHWPSMAAIAVLTRLRAILEEDAGGAGRHCQVVVVVPDTDQPELVAAAGASAEAMRGIVQSVSREVDPAVLRVNLVIGDQRGPEEVVRSVRFLASASGGFFVGSTVDVR
jgi:hypothetical protein